MQFISLSDFTGYCGSAVFIRISNLKIEPTQKYNYNFHDEPSYKASADHTKHREILNCNSSYLWNGFLILEANSKFQHQNNNSTIQRPILRDDSRCYIVGQIEERNGRMSWTNLD